MIRGGVHDQVVTDRALPLHREQHQSGNGRSRPSHPHRPYGDLRTVDQKLGAVLTL
jgi:hypothetical protein